MKEKAQKQPKQPDPMRMKASDFDQMMRHALGAPPERKASKKKPSRKKR